MTQREFERIFHISGDGHVSASVPDVCRPDIEKGLTVRELFAEIEEGEEKRLRAIRYHPRFDQGPPPPGFINWRLPIGDYGDGATITIAQQLVYIGNVSFLNRRQRTNDLMKHLLEADPNLAWGMMRFANGTSPDVTISLACYKARYDLVATMAFHPSAERYLPSYAPLLKRPCPKLCLVELVEDLIEYNSGKGNDSRRRDRDKCVEVLMRLHRRRHGLEQRILERVMGERLGPAGVSMSAGMITYWLR